MDPEGWSNRWPVGSWGDPSQIHEDLKLHEWEQDGTTDRSLSELEEGSWEQTMPRRKVAIQDQSSGESELEIINKETTAVFTVLLKRQYNKGWGGGE